MKQSFFPIGILFALLSLFPACNREAEMEITNSVSVNSDALLMEFVSTDSIAFSKEQLSNARVVNELGHEVASFIKEEEYVTYLGFYPTFTAYPHGKDEVNQNYALYVGNQKVAVVQSSFKLDSALTKNYRKTNYYTNTENKIFNRPAESPVKILIGKNSAYKVEGYSRITLILNRPSVHLDTYSVDYQATISGFQGQSIQARQSGFFMTDNPDETSHVGIAIEGKVPHYYDADGQLQKPYDVVYEVTSEQIFGDREKHIAKITLSGDIPHHKVLACQLDGRQMDLNTVVEVDFLGRSSVTWEIR